MLKDQEDASITTRGASSAFVWDFGKCQRTFQHPDSGLPEMPMNEGCSVFNAFCSVFDAEHSSGTQSGIQKPCCVRRDVLDSNVHEACNDANVCTTCNASSINKTMNAISNVHILLYISFINYTIVFM